MNQSPIPFMSGARAVPDFRCAALVRTLIGIVVLPLMNRSSRTHHAEKHTG